MIVSASSRDRGGDRLDADRAAVELLDDRAQDLVVDLVQPQLVDVETAQRLARDVSGDHAVRPHLGVVAHAPQQAVGDARRAARAPGDLAARLVVDWHAEDAGGALDDLAAIAPRS